MICFMHVTLVLITCFNLFRCKDTQKILLIFSRNSFNQEILYSRARANLISTLKRTLKNPPSSIKQGSDVPGHKTFIICLDPEHFIEDTVISMLSPLPIGFLDCLTTTKLTPTTAAERNVQLYKGQYGA